MVKILIKPNENYSEHLSKNLPNTQQIPNFRYTESHPDVGLGNLICSNCGGTVIQWRPLVTNASASSIPNPYARLTKIPALFLVNEALGESEGLEVYTIKY